LAPDLAAVPAYAETPIAKRLKIGAYFSLPIHHADGRVFGMLCGADPVKQPEDIILRLAPVRLVADMLSHVLAIEMRCVASERECERIASEATRDALTGLYNRRGWMQFIDKEEWRCRRYGHSACILSIDLDGLKRANDSQGHAHGDDLLRRAGDVISETLRKSDIVARVGGDEFCILCIECEIDQIDGLVVRLREKLAEAGVSASIGRAMRIPGEGLEAACTKADHDMYLDKAQRRELAGHEFG
jgi:diguanylate cyclase (GGDEF)-like protein